MRMSKRLRLAVTLAPVLGAVAFAIHAQAAPSGTSGGHHFEGGAGGFSGGARGDFRGGGFRDHHGRRDFDRFGFGFGLGFWDPWWGWDPAYYWGYPYPYYYPPYPAYYPPPAEPPPQAPVQATGAPPPQFWYYCDDPQGYYPYVQNCTSAWRQVTPTAPQSGNTITPQQKQ